MQTKLLFTISIAILCSNLFAQHSKKTERVYDFAETSDNSYCSPDSILTMDCAGGSLYLTNAGTIYLNKNGNVIYTFLNEDSTIYNIGSYTMSRNRITCIFDRTYSCENNFYTNEKENISGTLKKTKPRNLELTKLSCKKFDYRFISNEKRKYVVYKCSRSDSEYFINNLKKDKVLFNFEE